MTSHGKVCRRDLQGAVNRVRVWEPGTKQVQQTLVPGLNFWLCHLKDRFGGRGGAIRIVFNFLSQVIACWVMWQLLPRLAEILLCADPTLGDHELLAWFPPAGISARTPVLGVAAFPASCTVPDT